MILIRQIMKRLYMAATLLLSITATASADALFIDDFSDGNLSGWNISGRGSSKVSGGAARLSKTKSMTQTVSTVDWKNISVFVDHSSQGLEPGDSCLSEISANNGASFITIGNTTTGASTESLTPGVIDNNSSVVLRMSSQTNHRKDYCFFDNIALVGNPVTSTPEAEITVTGNGAFGSIEIGANATTVITVRNDGDANLEIGLVTGVSSTFSIDSDNCSNTALAPLYSCGITVKYSPVDETTSTATLSIPSNDPDESVSTVALAGTGYITGSGGSVLFTEDFESSYDGWVIGGSGDFGVVSKGGSLALNLARDSSATISITTSGAQDVVVSLDMLASSLESGETCIVQAQGTGGWVTVGMLENGQDNRSVYPVSASNGTFDNTTLTLRLRANGNINSDDCYFDNISVESIPGGVPRSEASYAYLMGNADQTFSASAFAQTQTAPPTNTFQGRLVISGSPVFSKNYGLTGNLPTGYSNWPGFDYEFVQDNNRLIPVHRGHGFIGNGAWSVSAGVGAVWDEAGDNGYSRAAFPYTIKQNNSNCEHNGLATFLFKNDGSISNVHVQNVAETCIFYGFEFYGTLSGSYIPGQISTAAQVIAERNAEEAARIPVRPLADLAIDFPGVDLANYGYMIDSADLNGYSVLVNGISYMDGCTTRYGPHPYCAEKTTGVYSFTKSMHAFMVVAALEKQYPGFKNRLITDLVPECAGDNRWEGVTVEHALDMATGNYSSANYEVDEGGSAIVSGFFDPATRAQRAAFACGGWPHKTAPGTYHVYHTTDTELVGYAAAKFANTMLGGSAEAFNDILAPIYDAIGLSHYIRGIQRTTDTRDAWGGYGLSVTLNDVVRVAQYLRDEAIADGLLDPTMVSEVLSGSTQGLYAQLNNFNYDNGFWRYHAGAASAMSACGSSTQVPVMSGYGGHTTVIMPDVIITQLTDGGGIGFLNTVNDVFNNISNTCPAN